MEQINAIELNDEGVYPDNSVLEKVLGEAYPAYVALIELFNENEMTYEWRYYRDGNAWLCKVQKKKRTIVWMSAWKGFMKATIYFPEKHAAGIEGLELADETKRRISAAKNVGTSKPCMFEIRGKDAIEDMKVVMAYKLNTK